MNVIDTTKKNYNAIDVAKLVCAFLVVAVHCRPFGVYDQPNKFFLLDHFLSEVLCRVAVPLFFVFSGFFLYKKSNLNEFSFSAVKGYVLHILGMYIIWTLIYLPIEIGNVIYEPNGIWYGVTEYVKRILFTGSYTQLWYLNALLFAVILISSLLTMKLSAKKILIISLVLYIIGLFGDSYFGFIASLQDVPIIGDGIRFYFDVFKTTRNGLFFGFFFVSLGMYLSQGVKVPSKKTSFYLFIVSLILVFAESYLLRFFKIAIDYNMFVFSIPVVLFCFCFLSSLEIKGNEQCYKDMREISTLIYLGHLWVAFFVRKICDWLFPNIFLYKAMAFVFTSVVTFIIALIVVRISKNEKMKWIKKLY